MERKALLLVSFGTANPAALERDLAPVERAVAAALPGYLPLRVFGSGIVIRKLCSREGIAVCDLTEALGRLREQGFRRVLVQPTFLTEGREYRAMLGQLQRNGDWLSSLRVGRPLLGDRTDALELAAHLAEVFPAERGPLLLMGHGAAAHLAAALPEHLYYAAMEGRPGLEEVMVQLREGGIRKLTLMPLMLTAGKHALTDMASNLPHSWKSRLASGGIRADCLIRGLGSWEFVQNMYVRHALEAVSLGEALDFPGKADKLELQK